MWHSSVRRDERQFGERHAPVRHVCANMCVDARMGVHVGMRVGICVDTCVGVHIDMRRGMRVRRIRGGCKAVRRHACGRVCAHTYVHACRRNGRLFFIIFVHAGTSAPSGGGHGIGAGSSNSVARYGSQSSSAPSSR